jgi:hypothetical protein
MRHDIPLVFRERNRTVHGVVALFGRGGGLSNDCLSEAAVNDCGFQGSRSEQVQEDIDVLEDSQVEVSGSSRSH